MSDTEEVKSIDRYISNLTDEKERERLTILREKQERGEYATVLL